MIATKRKRLKVGDVLEIRADDRFAYVQFIGKHPDYGDALLVCPRLQERLESLALEIFSDGYVTFYPATYAVNHGFAKVVANLPAPGLPERLRRAGKRTGTRIDTWIIQDGSKEVVKTKLSEEELQLPIVSIWNHAFLVDRIAEGWNPRNVGREPGGDGLAVRGVAAPAHGNGPRPIRHYLYVPTRKIVEEVAQELQRRGFDTEEQLGADDKNWLILARHEAVFTEELIASTRVSMEALMETVGGEYDGWEVDVRNPESRH